MRRASRLLLQDDFVRLWIITRTTEATLRM
jgi:hypothetical protein